MVKVLITGVVVNPPYSLGYSPGEEALVSQEMAKRLIDAGLATALKEAPQKAVKQEAEKR